MERYKVKFEQHTKNILGYAVKLEIVNLFINSCVESELVKQVQSTLLELIQNSENNFIMLLSNNEVVEKNIVL